MAEDDEVRGEYVGPADVGAPQMMWDEEEAMEEDDGGGDEGGEDGAEEEECEWENLFFQAKGTAALIT